MHELLLSEAEGKRNLYARVLTLSIVEFFEDIGQLLGKEYRSRISLLNNHEVFIKKLNLIAKHLNNLRSRHEKSLRQIRNAVIAHKEHNTIQQIKIIHELDLKSIGALSIDIMNWCTSFINFSGDLIKHMHYEYELNKS